MRNEILLVVIITNANAHLLVIIVFEFFQTENSTFPRKKRKGKKNCNKTEETKKMERDLDSWCFLVGPGFFGVFGGLVILVSLVWRFRREFCYLGAFFVAAS